MRLKAKEGNGKYRSVQSYVSQSQSWSIGNHIDHGHNHGQCAVYFFGLGHLIPENIYVQSRGVGAGNCQNSCLKHVF